jgi:hypothetical protein
MHSILLSIEIPKKANESDDDQLRKKTLAWQNLARELQLIATQNKKIEMLGENCWLLPADHGLPFLARAIHTSAGSGLAYRVLFFDEEPKWIHGNR